MKITYDGSVVDTDDITKAVSGFGYSAKLARVSGGQSCVHRTVFHVSGLDCADCAVKLEKRIFTLSGIRSAQVNFATGKLTVEHTVSETDIIKAVQQAGYSAERESKGSKSIESKSAWWNPIGELKLLLYQEYSF
jgi:Cd2+/Zn2+-exporting ATPase